MAVLACSIIGTTCATPSGRVRPLCFAGSPLSLSAHNWERAGRAVYKRKDHGPRRLTMQRMGRKQGEFDLLSGQDFDLLAFRYAIPECSYTYIFIYVHMYLHIYLYIYYI